MRDDYKEQLSAFVDDELRPEESRFLAARIGQDGAAHTCVGRYALIRHALDRSLPTDRERSRRAVADGVARALELEPAHNGQQSAGWRRRAQPIAGLALAAGVAALTVGLWPEAGPRPVAQPGTTGELAGPSAPPRTGARAVADDARTSSGVRRAAAIQQPGGKLDPALRARLTSYMVNHSEHAANGGVGGVLTYVRIAGHDAND